MPEFSVSDMGTTQRTEYNIRAWHDHNHRHHPQRRDRAHLLDPACRQCAGADPRRGRAAGGRRPHRAAADAGRAQRREARRRRQELRRGMDHRPRRRRWPIRPSRVFFDAAATSQRAGRRWKRPSPPASTSIPRSRWRCRSDKGLELLRAMQGARAQARRGRGQARPARLAEARRGSRRRISSAASPASASSSAGGCSTAPRCPASGRAGTTARRTAAG